MLSQSQKILLSLKLQAKITLPTGNHRTLPKRDKEKNNSKKMRKARFGLMSFMQPREPLVLSLMVTNCSEERSFSRFKIIKKELKGRSVPGQLAHTKHSVH